MSNVVDDLDLDFDELDAVLQEVDNSINMQGKTVTEILGLSQKIEPQTHSVVHYDVDIDMYEDLYVASSVMQESVADGMQEITTFDTLHQDMFLSLFKYQPEIIPESHMKRSTRINNRIMRKLVELPEYRDLRRHCRLDLFNAALGTEVIGEKAVQIIKDWKQEALDALQQRQQGGGAGSGSGGPGGSGGSGGAGNNNQIPNPFVAIEQLQKAEQQLDDLLEEQKNLQAILDDMKNAGGGSGMAGIQKQLDDLALSIQEAEQLANMAADQCDDFIDNNDDLLDNLATKFMGAFSEVDEMVAETTDYLDAWGLDEGEACRVPFAEKKEAVERIRDTKKLKDLTKLIGRFKESAINEQKKKSKDGATSIKSVKMGSNIQDVLPSEKMKLCNDITKKDFYRKFNQKELMQYEKNSTKRKSQGPMIICNDESGSMEGSREKWSKAVSIAMLEIANQQKRDYAYIAYGSTANEPVIIEKNEINPTKVLNIAERFINGGTNFEAPLRKAMDLIKTSKFKNADIVFITDGDCSISSEFKRKFNALKEEKEFSCMGILVNTGGGRVSDKSLKEFCDVIHTVGSIADLNNAESDTAKAIFSGV
jgi:uncharacterized protein with von Willebrand factor type A (vWA) domain